MSLTLLVIPIVSGLIGWGTNALAIRMLFSPLERRGLWRVGWQGVLPANAERMATVCVQLMTAHLLDVRAVFAQIDPKHVSALLSPALEKHASEVAESVLAVQYPRAWEALPESLREHARGRIRAEVPRVVEKLMAELNDDLDRYLAVETLVVSAFVENKALLNELFQTCGRAEFRFISRSGLAFGFLLGCAQAAIWSHTQPLWFLPMTGLLIGWLTNWAALKMVFEPKQPKTLGPLRWQGLFLMRQGEVSEAYATFFAEQILHPEALVNAVLKGPASDRLTDVLTRFVAEGVDSATGGAKPIIQLAAGTENWRLLRQRISEELVTRVPSELSRVHAYASEALSLQDTLNSRLSTLPPEQFEQVLRPLFRQDESKLIAVGAMLGGIAGILQLLFVGV